MSFFASQVATRNAVVLALALVALGCSGEHAVVPRARGKIAISSGNAQRGSPGQPLRQPIILVVRDAAGNPAGGVSVTWFADDGGAIEPPQSITDRDGLASAAWTLGGAAMHHGHAVADGYFDAEFTASTDVNAELPLDIIQPLELTTYDGSGQTVHPDYVTMGDSPTANQYLFITPYPNGNSVYENPSIFQRDKVMQWFVPTGFTNPIALPREGYYSDPDALYVPERGEIWLYFRQVSSENVIRLTTSSDGVTWSTPVVVAHAPNHEIISPTVVRRATNEWFMWAVNGNVGCSGPSATVELRRSTNGVDWVKSDVVDLVQPGLFPWHIDIEWIPSRGEFWALYNAKTPGSCTTTAVYLATSTDGVHWQTYPSPVLARSAITEFRDVVYRSTFAYDESSDAITIWFSGARFEGANYLWHSAVQRRLRADVFATISAPPAARSSLLPSASLPQLTKFP